MFAAKSATFKPAARCGRFIPAQAHKADRRALLGGVMAGVASLASTGAAWADATPVDLFDDRSVKKRGFDIIYEARDLDLPQNVRDGITQYKGDLTATKARFEEAKGRINTQLKGYVEKEYWTLAKEEMRQISNLRQDLLTLSSAATNKADRKAGATKAKALLDACTDLDEAIKKKDAKLATSLYASVQDKLSSFQSTIIA